MPPELPYSKSGRADWCQSSPLEGCMAPSLRMFESFYQCLERSPCRYSSSEFPCQESGATYSEDWHRPVEQQRWGVDSVERHLHEIGPFYHRLEWDKYFEPTFPEEGAAGVLRKPKKKRRNTEIRKERSRNAARCRRGKESEVFSDLASTLPLPAKTVAQLDKASIMRLAIAYLNTRELFTHGFPLASSDELDLDLKEEEEEEGGVMQDAAFGSRSADPPVLLTKPKLEEEVDTTFDYLLQKSLVGFLFILSTEGDVIYVSESISTYLGLAHDDVMGQSLYEYAHPCDHEDVKALISNKGAEKSRHTFLRLKCTLTNKGRSINLRSANYKAVQINGAFLQNRDVTSNKNWIIALATPVPHPTNIEFPILSHTFFSKHSLDLRFTYVDDSIEEFTKFEPKHVTGRTLYELHHAMDVDIIREAHRTLKNKGQVETLQYRFLTRGGGYIWLVTQATLITGPKESKPQYIVCVNYVISGIEDEDKILSELQIVPEDTETNAPSPAHPNTLVRELTSDSLPISLPPLKKQVASEFVSSFASKSPPYLIIPPLSTPVPSTSSIFLQLTKEGKEDTVLPLDTSTDAVKENAESLMRVAPSIGDPEVDYFATFIAHSESHVTSSPHHSISSQSSLESASNGDDEKEVLLSQACVCYCEDKGSLTSSASVEVPAASHPIATTASLFSDDHYTPLLDRMDLLSHNFKLEDGLDNEDFESRAPYITPCDESLDELLWSEPLSGSELSPLGFSKSEMSVDKEDSALSRILEDSGLPSCRNLKDGSNFINPNLILPVHFLEESNNKSSTIQDTHLISHDKNEATPPLVPCDSSDSRAECHEGMKRVATGATEVPNVRPCKKMCSSSTSFLPNTFSSVPTFRGVHSLPAPNAPTMQHLLTNQSVGYPNEDLEMVHFVVPSSQVLNGTKFTLSKVPSSKMSLMTTAPLSTASTQYKYKLKNKGTSFLSSSTEAADKDPSLSRMVRQHDPMLLFDPNVPISSLLDLTDFDFEVNAPVSSSSALQGSELLRALDQNF